MEEDFRTYFEERVIALIDREHPEVIPEMSVMMMGSISSGESDELSDLDAEIYLPEKLWREHGGQLMLTLLNRLDPFIAHPYADVSFDPHDWHHFRHSEIAVHPLSRLLGGQAEAVLAGGEIRWEDIPMEELLQIQIHPTLRDAHGRIARLREATTPTHYPERLWIKHLILTLSDLMGEPEALYKAVRRNRPLEAQMILGNMLPRLFRLAFLVNRRYYPWRRCFHRLFNALPINPMELGSEFEILGSGAEWSEKYMAIDRIVRTLTELILKSEMLSTDTFRFLTLARSERAWENPDWLDRHKTRWSQAEEAGYNKLDGWVWDRWDWP